MFQRLPWQIFSCPAHEFCCSLRSGSVDARPARVDEDTPQQLEAEKVTIHIDSVQMLDAKREVQILAEKKNSRADRGALGITLSG